MIVMTNNYLADAGCQSDILCYMEHVVLAAAELNQSVRDSSSAPLLVQKVLQRVLRIIHDG